MYQTQQEANMLQATATWNQRKLLRWKDDVHSIAIWVKTSQPSPIKLREDKRAWEQALTRLSPEEHRMVQCLRVD